MPDRSCRCHAGCSSLKTSQDPERLSNKPRGSFSISCRKVGGGRRGKQREPVSIEKQGASQVLRIDTHTASTLALEAPVPVIVLL